VPLTPALRGLASEGTTFTSAWANAPWTVPSHASIFTGQLPSTHRCTGRNWRFAYRGPTLAERLNEGGYRTMAFFSNPWLTDRLTGVMRGFDEQYVDPRILGRAFNAPDQGGVKTVDVIDEWLGRADRDRPFLMFVNILEAHLPYAPTRRYREAFLPGVDPWEYVHSELADSVNARLKDPGDVDWEHVRRMYAGDVSHADDLLGSLLEVLDTHDLYEDTIIIVTSDHGELIGEHGFFEHQFGVYEELLAVPLVIRAPGRLEPGVRRDPAMLSDLYATVLDCAGLDPGVDPAGSRSLLEEPAADDRPVFAEYAGPSRPLQNKLRAIAPRLEAPFLTTAYLTVRVGGLRLTLGSDGTSTLQDLSENPMPEDELRRRGDALEATLRGLLPQSGPSMGRVDTDPELEQRLRSLGYVR
jgi:arylsulfatase A-like enzyme